MVNTNTGSTLTGFVDASHSTLFDKVIGIRLHNVALQATRPCFVRDTPSITPQVVARDVGFRPAVPLPAVAILFVHSAKDTPWHSSHQA
jgi:hypothetical protein